jgi:O-antigen biosynthesis protein
MAAPITLRTGPKSDQPFEPIRLLHIELTQRLQDTTGLEGYRSARALVRDHGAPVGCVDVEVRHDTCHADDIRAAVDRAGLGQRRAAPADEWRGPWPRVTAAVCTRGRPVDLKQCLTHLVRVDYPDLEILVVDNAPEDGANAAICAAYPRVRHVVEPRPGLNWARNRAVLEATGEIIAFTDDDVRVETGWVRELVTPLLQESSTMAVAGLGVPLEIETPAQLLFEDFGGVSGGFDRIHMRGGADWGVRGTWHYGLMAPHGSGANMAFRRTVFDEIGMFDPALDVGTPANGGGDTEMLFRVLMHGHGMVYEPRAVIRHRHRRDFAGVKRQISGWGSGMYALLTRSILAFPRAWWVLVLLGVRGIAQLLVALLRPQGLPRRLLLTQLGGALTGPLRYFQARLQARTIERRFGPQTRKEGT